MKKRWGIPVGFGLAAGVVIAAVDNLAFHGEVSPTVIVALLLIATATAGCIWGRRGFPAALTTGLCVPLSHVIEHVLGLPDTLQPNTYASILMLAAFTLVTSTIGIGCGVLLRTVSVEQRPQPR
jgi:hypothetical protein